MRYYIVCVLLFIGLMVTTCAKEPDEMEEAPAAPVIVEEPRPVPAAALPFWSWLPVIFLLVFFALGCRAVFQEQFWLAGVWTLLLCVALFSTKSLLSAQWRFLVQKAKYQRYIMDQRSREDHCPRPVGYVLRRFEYYDHSNRYGHWFTHIYLMGKYQETRQTKNISDTLMLGLDQYYVRGDSLYRYPPCD